jgi:hypothetical protein
MRNTGEAMEWMPGVIRAGYGVASGTGTDRRYPAGTIALQQPFFLAEGIDLSACYPGTLNIDLAPYRPSPRQPVFDGVLRWYGDIAERFILSPAMLEANGQRHAGLWYYPHPDTKPCHFQQDTMVELLLPWIAGLKPGMRVLVGLPQEGAAPEA